MTEKFEGFQPRVTQQFIDRANVWSFGFGSTNLKHPGVKLGEPISKPDAEKLLIEDLKDFGAVVSHKFKGFDDLPQSVKDSCVSYAYGCGVNALNKEPLHIMDNILASKNPNGSFDVVKLKNAVQLFEQGIHTAKGVTLGGLVAKRREETKMGLEGLTNVNVASQIANAGSVPNHLGRKAEPIAQPSNQGRAVIVDTNLLVAQNAPAPKVMPHPTAMPAAPVPAPSLNG